MPQESCLLLLVFFVNIECQSPIQFIFLPSQLLNHPQFLKIPHQYLFDKLWDIFIINKISQIVLPTSIVFKHLGIEPWSLSAAIVGQTQKFVVFVCRQVVVIGFISIRLFFLFPTQLLIQSQTLLLQFFQLQICHEIGDVDKSWNRWGYPLSHQYILRIISEFCSRFFTHFLVSFETLSCTFKKKPTSLFFQSFQKLSVAKQIAL